MARANSLHDQQMNREMVRLVRKMRDWRAAHRGKDLGKGMM